MSNVCLGLAVVCAALEWFAIQRGRRRLEYFAKPGVMAFMFLWLVLGPGLRGGMTWFGAGVMLSLVGDTLLLFELRGKGFLAGLGAFLLAHIAYLVGLNSPPPPFSAMTFGVALIVALSAMPIVRRILLALAQKRLRRLVEPVRWYATAISLTLFSALITLFRSDWASTPAYLVSLGAVMLVASDVLLAWNKFVAPVRRGRLLLMVLYHLGQFALLLGAAGQFTA